MMNNKLFLVVLFFVLGSAAVSSMDFLNYTFKSIFYRTAMIVLVVIGLVGLSKYFKVKKV